MKLALAVAASVLVSRDESALVVRRQQPVALSMANASFGQAVEAACMDTRVGKVTCDLLRSFLVCSTCKGNLQRIGEQMDGGYLTCEVPGAPAPAAGLSFGINGFDGWGDEYAAKHQIPMYQYDCFNQNIPSCPSGKCHFSPTCVQDGAHVGDPRFQTLAALMDRTAPSKEVIVKMDVELAEWGAIAATDDAHLGRIQQFILEFHGLGDVNRHGEFLAVMQKLLRHFHVVHNHGNNCCDTAIFGSYAIPTVFEVTFARKDFAEVTDCKSTRLHAQDAPNGAGTSWNHHPLRVKLEPFL